MKVFQFDFILNSQFVNSVIFMKLHVEVVRVQHLTHASVIKDIQRNCDFVETSFLRKRQFEEEDKACLRNLRNFTLKLTFHQIITSTQ